jgi:hypothetical protein
MNIFTRFALAFVFLCPLLTGCARSDAQIQRALIGTWIETGENFRSTRIVSPSGTFDFQITAFKNGITDKEAGTLLAKDGGLIITLTNDSRINASFMPIGLHGRIVRLSEHDLVVRWDGLDQDRVLQRTKP